MTATRLLQAFFRLVFRLVYRYEVEGLENLENIAPGTRTLVVVNHVSYLDGALIFAIMRHRIPVIAIDTRQAEKWFVRPFRNVANLFPLDPANPLAVKSLIAKVNEGHPCVIFPEGRISVTGALMKIYQGPAYIADRTDACIVPVRLDGPETSKLFSWMRRGQVKLHWAPKIRVTIRPPVRLDLGPAARGKDRRAVAGRRLYDIMSDMVFRTSDWGGTLFEALLRARWRHGRRYPALCDTSDKTLTYARLVVAALALGRRLAADTEPGERVGVLLPNVDAVAVTFFALQAFGRVPAMLNFSAGPANVAAAVETARLRRVVTSAEFVARAGLEPLVAAIEGAGAGTVRLEEVGASIGAGAKLRALFDAQRARSLHRAFGIRRDDPAVVLFTSGSEGKPKGVVLSHANLIANCTQIAARVDFNQLDRVFNALPVFHSFGLTGAMLLPLLGGVRVYLYPSPLHYRVVPTLVYDTDSTIIFGTNAFLKGYGKAGDPYDFRSLRYAFAGAEPLQEETQGIWFEKFGIRILTGYGATETSPVISLNTPMFHKDGTVGRFLPGMEWRLEPVAGLEEGGRLHLRGPNVMLGYLRHENPGVLEPPEGGWYDTGDIVTVDEAGFVAIVGRAKRFAKIGGEMVSLAAVEEFLHRLRPDSALAAVALPDPRKGERVVLVTTDPKLDRGAVVQAAKAQGVPELMIPAEVAHVPELPLLGTGKTDYPAVQKLVADRLGQAA